MVTAHFWGHDVAPSTRQNGPKDVRDTAAFRASLKDARTVPRDVSKSKLRGPPSSAKQISAAKGRRSSTAAVESEPVSEIDWSDPGAIRLYLIDFHDREPETAVPNEVIRNGIINPRALEGFTRDFAKELRSLPPGADRDALAPLVAKLELLPRRLYEDCVAIAAETPGEPLEPALAIEHLADLFDDMLLACNQAKKNAPTEEAKALIGWVAAMMAASKRMARTDSTIPLVKLAGRRGFAALKRTAYQNGPPRSGHSVTYGNNIGAQGGFGFTKGNGGFLKANLLGLVGRTKSDSFSTDKDGDLNRIKLRGLKAGLKASLGIFGLISTSAGVNALHEKGPFTEGPMDADGMAIVASQYSVFQGRIKRLLFAGHANAGARERHEAGRSFKSFWRLFVSGHRDPIPDKVPYFMNDAKMGKGVSRVGIHQAGCQVGAHLDAEEGGHRHTDAIDRILCKYFPRNQDFQRIAEKGENPEKALADLYLENWNHERSAPDLVTENMKGCLDTWRQTTFTANADLRISPLSLQHFDANVLIDNFHTPFSFHLDGSVTGWVKYRKLLASRINRRVEEMMSLKYLKEGPAVFEFMGEVWNTYGKHGTESGGRGGAHPALYLADRFAPRFGRSEARGAVHFDKARREFYGDPAAMSPQHRNAAAALAKGGDPVALMNEINQKLDELARDHGRFMRDVDETMPGAFFPPEAALNRINQSIFGGEYPLDGTPEATLNIQADGANSFSLALANLMLLHGVAKYETFLSGKPNPVADKLGEAIDERCNDIGKMLEREPIAMRRSDSHRRAVFTTKAASTKLSTFVGADFALNPCDVAQTIANLDSSVLPVLPFQQNPIDFSISHEIDRVDSHSDPGRVGRYYTVNASAAVSHAPRLLTRAVRKLFGRKPEIPAETVDKRFWKDIADYGFQGLFNNDGFRQVTKVYHRLPDVAKRRLVEKLETKTVYGGHKNDASIATPNLASAAAAKGIPAVFNLTAGTDSGRQKVIGFKLGGDVQNNLLHFTGQYSKLFVADADGGLDIAATAAAFKKDPMLMDALFSDEGAFFDVLNQIIQFDPNDPFAPFIDIDWRTRNSANPMAFYVDEDRMRVFKASAKANYFSARSGEIASAGPDKESAVLELFKECRRLRRDEPKLLPRIRELFIEQKDWTPEEQFNFLTKTKEGRHLLRTFYSLMSKLAEARLDLLSARGYVLRVNKPYFDSFPTTYSPAPAVAAH
jgi:hypothetical protein